MTLRDIKFCESLLKVIFSFSSFFPPSFYFFTLCLQNYTTWATFFFLVFLSHCKHLNMFQLFFLFYFLKGCVRFLALQQNAQDGQHKGKSVLFGHMV